MTAIFYAATKPTIDEYLIWDEGRGPKLFVRVELKNYTDSLRALDNARPRKGEIVLNSLELDETD